MKLKEIRLFKLAEDDNFGSNIGAEFITNGGKSTKVYAKSVTDDDTIKCTESNKMDFLYELDEQNNSKIRSVRKCYCCAILFYDSLNR